MSSVTITAATDTYARDDQSSTNFSTATTALLSNTTGKSVVESNVALEFDLGANLPVGSEITAATLRLIPVAFPVLTAIVDVRRITEDFTSSEMTWDDASSGNAWSTAGIVTDDVDAHVFDFPGAGSPIDDPSMRGMARTAYSTGDTQIVKPRLSTDADDSLTFCTTNDSPPCGPELIVTFTVPKRYRTRGMRRCPANGQQNAFAGC